MRCTEMQLWPANENAFAASLAAVPGGASAQTIAGVALPSSSFTRLRGARSAMPQPTSPGAGERDQLHALVLDEHVADLGRGAGDDVEPAGRQARLLLELGEEQRRERCRGRRLEDDRAAGGERRRDLVGDEVEREVERRDRADDPDRQPQRERELALAGRRGVHRHHLARRACAPRRRRRCTSRRRAALDARRLQRLARPRRRSAAQLPPGAPRAAARSHRGCARARAQAAGSPARRPRRPARAAPRRRRPSAMRPTTSPEYGERTSIQSPVSTRSPPISSGWSVGRRHGATVMRGCGL